MSWLDDLSRMKSLSNKLGSSYAATLYVAKKSRLIFDKCNGVLSYGESVKCALTDTLPKDIKYRIRKYQQASEMREHTYVDEILSDIDDKIIRDAVSNSYRLSLNSRHIEYDYKGIEDENIRARIRILTKMCYCRKR